ncbi:MAG: hypothetical protein ACYTG0_15365 [Planctomycetota bacterium]|jgi:hypothetical protein
MKRFVLLVVLLWLLVFPVAADPKESPLQDLAGKVVSVAEGDTVMFARARYLEYIVELLGLGVFFTFLTCISWSKFLVGAFLVVGAVYFPQLRADRKEEGSFKYSSERSKMIFKGSLRFGMLCAGIVLGLAAVIDGHAKFIEQEVQTEFDSRLDDMPNIEPTFQPEEYETEVPQSVE